MGAVIQKFKSEKLQFKLGVCVVILLGLMILFPWLFTQANPFGTEAMRGMSDAEGHFIIQSAPFPPQWGIPLGTDIVGRHIWALIVYGTKLTMTLAAFVVLSRFMIAIPLGFSAGFGSLISKTIIKQFSLVFGAIPALLLSVIILRMNFFVELDKNMSIIAFIILLTVVGWGKLGLVIEERVLQLIKEPFVVGEIAIGKSKLQIAFGTILPHLLPELVVLFFLEMARALMILMQLGIFNVFVGSVRFIEDSGPSGYKYMDLAYEPEWAGMLGTARNQIRSAPWTAIFPALAFFVSVFGLNAFGEGLREKIQAENQSWSWTHLKLHMAQWNHKVKRGIVGCLVVCILFSTFGPSLVSQWRFNLSNVELTGLNINNGPVLIGNENRDSAAQWLSKNLSGRGYTCMGGIDGLQHYPMKPVYYVEKSEVVLAGEKPLQLGSDYAWTSFSTVNFKEKQVMTNWTKEDLFAIASSGLKNKQTNGNLGVVVVDADLYTKKAVVNLTKKLAYIPSIKGIIWLTENNVDDLETMGDTTYPVPTLMMKKHLLMNKLATKVPLDCTIQQSSRLLTGEGKNVVAYRMGESQSVGDEAIIYGFSYNAPTKIESERKIKYAMAFLDALERNPKNKNRTIIVAFLDGTLCDAVNGVRVFGTSLPVEMRKVTLYVDMSRIEGVSEGTLYYNQQQAPISHYYAYTFAMQMKEALDKQGIRNAYVEKDVMTYATDENLPATLFMGITCGIPTIELRVSSLKEQTNEGIASIEKLGRLITNVVSHNNY